MDRRQMSFLKWFITAQVIVIMLGIWTQYFYTENKLDKILDNWNGCKMLCEDRWTGRLDSHVQTLGNHNDALEEALAVTRALCEWALAHVVSGTFEPGLAEVCEKARPWAKKKGTVKSKPWDLRGEHDCTFETYSGGKVEGWTVEDER